MEHTDIATAIDAIATQLRLYPTNPEVVAHGLSIFQVQQHPPLLALRRGRGI
jgi:hypothetical protein